MAGYGYDSTLDMPWPRAKMLAAAVDRARTAELVERATAVRAGMSSKQDWAKWIREIEKSQP